MMNWDKPPSRTYGSATLAALRLASFLTLVILMVPVHVVYSAVRPNDHYRLPLLFHRILLRLIGFHVKVHGTIATGSPVFFISNHASYLDIPVLGALLPAAFIAKAEVAKWPLFGLLAKLQGTVFIERRTSRVNQQRDQLMDYLAKGRNLILFPEGTSSEGCMVLPFKSSLFSAIENAARDIDVIVQPLSITCTAVDGLPLTQNLRSMYSWYGDMTLMPHLWQAFKCNSFNVDVVFHASLHAKEFPNRKLLAAHCQMAVASGVEQCVTGRWLTNDHEPIKKIAAPAA